MHEYHALMHHRGHHGAQKLPLILLHHLCKKKPSEAIDAEHQGDFLSPPPLIWIKSSSLQALPFVS